MSKSKKINVDRNKLREYIKTHGIVSANLSREIGASARYISKVLGSSNNQMSLMGYKAMCTALHVPEETFLIKDVEPAPTTDGTQLDRIEKKFDKLLQELGVK